MTTMKIIKKIKNFLYFFSTYGEICQTSNTKRIRKIFAGDNQKQKFVNSALWTSLNSFFILKQLNSQ